jgi:hypothetical protein
MTTNLFSSYSQGTAGRPKRLLAVLIIAVLIIVGLFVLIFGGKSNPAPVKSASGWKPMSLTSEKLSFQIPTTWKVNEDETESSQPPQNIVILSPTINNYFFSLELSSGKAQDILYQDFLGQGKGTTLLKLNSTNAKQQLYTVAKLTDTDQNVAGISIATTPGGQSTSFGIADKTGGNDNITVSAVLYSTTPTSSPQSYSLKFYESQPGYQNLLTIFKSLRFK